MLTNTSNSTGNYYHSCSPRDRGLGLETARDRDSAVVVLIFALEVLVLVLKHWYRPYVKCNAEL